MDTNHLLLVAITEYKWLTPLENCVNDAEEIKKVLFDKYFFEEEHTTCLYNENASYNKISDALTNYVKSLKSTDNLIIYLSGHGDLDEDTERGYWCPYDAKSKDYASYFSNADLLDYLSKIKAKHIVIFSDSCFSRSILITETAKGITSLYNYPSRWALTTGEGYVYDTGYFSECIVSYLREVEKDVLISDLIQHVKHKFEINELQTPQGSPLRDINHKGGEFIFKIDENVVTDEREFKGYNDLLEVLHAYRPSSKFNQIAKFENKTSKIGYCIYQEFDDTLQKGAKAINYLYLYEGSYIKPSRAHIYDNYATKLKDRALIILLPKEKKQTNIKARIQNINRLFSPNSVFYIDDFILKRSSPTEFLKYKEEKYLDLPEFIFPTLQFTPHDSPNEIHTVSTNFVKNWFEIKNEPIIILKGIGGIGKTTMAKHFADIITTEFENAKTVFIESSKVVDELIQLERRGKKLDFYSFYQSLMKMLFDDSQLKLNSNIFRLNFDAGNLSVIIDGLDEIITRIPEFDIDGFLKSIEEYTKEMGNGKVIITCRSFFLDLKNYNSSKIIGIDILPFSYNQAEDFFLNCFKTDDKKIKKALILAKEFAFAEDSNNAKDYHPFALDIIRTIIDTPELINKQNAQPSSLLDKRVKIDYIIDSICDREIERVKQLSIHDQIKFFIYLTTTRRGSIRKTNFKNELESVLKKPVDNSTVLAFKSHTLLSHNSNTFKLRYDFLLDYFNSIYVCNYLKIEGYDETFQSELIDILAESCWFDSSMVKDICSRTQEWGGENLLKLSYLLRNIFNAEIEPLEKKRKALSGLFFIALALNHKFKDNNVELNTQLLQELYLTPENEIVGLHIINLANLKEPIRFNFSNITYRDCYFETYDYFWRCDFSGNPHFLDCSLFNLGREDLDAMPISKDNFSNCKYDKLFDEQFSVVKLKTEELIDQTKDFLRNFFKIFFSHGRLQPQTLDKQHTGTGSFNTVKKGYAKLASNPIEFNKLIDFLENQKVIESYREFAEIKVKIADNFKSDITKFCNDRKLSLPILQVAEKLTADIFKLSK